ncbi:hypothetical protein LOZ12_001465 [Ophidiomyces ophidiicola]|uniref:Uncharacterized protein n=1 Tax=Ophidiomyces ophidiicola TaxID=1387563 RepID=A0ACB8V4G5_9EURO|nr:hypothetical protein LOZ64_005766 [Ophidiomyces ophidiicola]KAI1908834.1 hypothetical protein LOZ61_005353 [Ophidiomyces ophidiicola]KAI1922332.1 hypothetical protein LOZ60_005762 [Ophidiomyces ophidiicola]KAI1937049.1 hypothetical protein LOZ62_005571 [Ophidiomyces ophidiicola]KAI1957859.1 hypothetical protein LOZ59_003750 [Ophidiomyces ophidiicola]
MEEIGDFFKAFFEASDDGNAHEKYPYFFAEDAKLIMGDKVAVGRADILTVRQGMWSAVSSRRHTYTYFTSPDTPNTVMLTGNVKYGMKDGSQKDTDWVAKATFEEGGSARKLGFYQVFLNAGRK